MFFCRATRALNRCRGHEYNHYHQQPFGLQHYLKRRVLNENQTVVTVQQHSNFTTSQIVQRGDDFDRKTRSSLSKKQRQSERHKKPSSADSKKPNFGNKPYSAAKELGFGNKPSSGSNSFADSKKPKFANKPSSQSKEAFKGKATTVSTRTKQVQSLDSYSPKKTVRSHSRPHKQNDVSTHKEHSGGSPASTSSASLPSSSFSTHDSSSFSSDEPQIDNRIARMWKGDIVPSAQCGADVSFIWKRLRKGLPVGVNRNEKFASVLRVYSRIKNKLGERDAISSFGENKKYNQYVHTTFKNMLLPLTTETYNDKRVTKLALSEIPTPLIPRGWLPQAESGEAEINFVPIKQYLGLQAAVRWFTNGIQYRQLDHKIFPEPGCYFAIPHSAWVVFHFEMFESWLKEGGLDGVDSAVDVGTGCGVLSYMLLKHGSDKLHITSVDINPAAVKTTNKTATEIGAFDEDGKLRLEAHQGNLFPKDHPCEKKDLIVFNPPWLPIDGDETEDLDSGDTENQIVLASYREHSLMDRFFEESHSRLNDTGRVCVIYSNMAKVVGAEEGLNAVERELAENSRFTLISKEEQPVPLGKSMLKGQAKAWKIDMVKQLTCQIYTLKKISE